LLVLLLFFGLLGAVGHFLQRALLGLLAFALQTRLPAALLALLLFLAKLDETRDDLDGLVDQLANTSSLLVDVGCGWKGGWGADVRDRV
jgi:hypothetical protein